MELYTDILNLFAKCKGKFPAALLYHYAFSSRTSVELSSDILHLQNVDIFSIHLKISMIFAFAIKTSVKLFIDINFTSVCKMSMEISIDIFLSIGDIDDIFLLLAKRRWKNPTIF